ncbi:hypothetical protein [Streptomyces sp. NPDC023838]|uniref:hypothetical protein n=1 Tax=Streptomyces sp. NPDC023838 TaxID=3154325 RepID=UPI0033FE1736
MSPNRAPDPTWHTVKQLADAATPEKLFTGQWQNRPSVIDDYKSHLDDRWNEGCTNAWKLWEEIVPLGYEGSYQRVRAFPHEKHTARRAVTARPPSPRTVAGWILRQPDTLIETEQLQLKAVRTHCSELDALTGHVRSFATMLTGRQGERLPDWLDAVRGDDLPSLHTLAAGIDRDRDAAVAGLTCPGTRVLSKAMSTGSSCSSARCSAVQVSPCSANVSCCPDGAGKFGYSPTARRLGRAHAAVPPGMR